TSMSPLLSHILWQKHYQVVTSELNQHWYLPHLLSLHTSAQRRLRKCEQAGFQFSRWEQPDLSEVYQFVKAARERKKFPISLPQESFKMLFERFPLQHQVFTVRDKEKIIALTVTIAVNSKILYNFYPADRADYLNFSPMVMLMKGIKAYAIAQHYELLDLGVSTEKGTPNFGLLRFKQNLGSSLSLKLTYNKRFS
ncbi:MAG: GNAT family N-acetyltransferase, partial [Bacteroidota bacterium]